MERIADRGWERSVEVPIEAQFTQILAPISAVDMTGNGKMIGRASLVPAVQSERDTIEEIDALLGG